jgi:hypothetical protein
LVVLPDGLFFLIFSFGIHNQHGVYFGITYADLIADVQVRRQTIPNAKRR